MIPDVYYIVKVNKKYLEVCVLMVSVGIKEAESLSWAAPVLDLMYLSSLILTGNAGSTMLYNSNSCLLELLSEVINDSFLKHQLKFTAMK